MIWNAWAASHLPQIGLLRHLSGVYATWEEASRRCANYDQPQIAAACASAARAVRDGQAAWERDSVLMPTVQFSWPVLAELLRVHAADGHLEVLDLGGGLGSSYRQWKAFAPDLPVRWTIVENSRLTELGRNEFTTEELQFAASLDEVMSRQLNVVLLSSVLQYLPQPEQLVATLKASGIRNLVVDRTPVGNRDFYSVQHVPDTIYSASYPIHVFSRPVFFHLFQKWQLHAEFPSYCDKPSRLFRGFIFRKAA